MIDVIGVAYYPISQLFAGGLPDSNDLDTELECLSSHLMIEVNGYRVSHDRDDGELDWSSGDSEPPRSSPASTPCHPGTGSLGTC